MLVFHIMRDERRSSVISLDTHDSSFQNAHRILEDKISIGGKRVNHLNVLRPWTISPKDAQDGTATYCIFLFVGDAKVGYGKCRGMDPGLHSRILQMEE